MAQSALDKGDFKHASTLALDALAIDDTSYDAHLYALLPALRHLSLRAYLRVYFGDTEAQTGCCLVVKAYLALVPASRCFLVFPSSRPVPGLPTSPTLALSSRMLLGKPVVVAPTKARGCKPCCAKCALFTQTARTRCLLSRRLPYGRSRVSASRGHRSPGAACLGRPGLSPDDRGPLC